MCFAGCWRRAHLQQAVERRLALLGRDGVRKRQGRLVELHLHQANNLAT